MSGWKERRKAPRPRREPVLARLETCWQAKGPSDRVMTCAIYGVDGPGIEVRSGYADDDPLRAQRTADVARAREIALEWRAALLAQGSFIELPVSPAAGGAAGGHGAASTSTPGFLRCGGCGARLRPAMVRTRSSDEWSPIWSCTRCGAEVPR